MSARAKVFMHGRSQAVRLPKAFRLPGSEVLVSKIGDRVILEPLERADGFPWALIDSTGDRLFMAGGREQPAEAPEPIAFDP